MKIKSSDGTREYNVTCESGQYKCDCPDFIHRNRECKHISKIKGTPRYENKKIDPPENKKFNDFDLGSI